jgi:hypothetical protein
MAQLVEARNIRWTRRLREDLQHLDELDADAPCSWKAILESRVAVAFRLAGGVPPFGYSHGGVFAAQLAKDRPKLFHVTSDAGGFVVHAWAQTNDVLFYPAAPLVLAGFVDLHSGARLRLSRASETTARFSYELATTDVAVWPTHVTEPAPCSQASLLDRHFEADPSDGRSDDVALLAASSSLPLTLTPTGPPVARLTVQSRCVKVLERRADHARVLIARDDDSLVGWIPSRQLGMHAGCPGTLGHGQGGGSNPFRDVPLPSARCSRDVPLGIEQGSKRELVGFIRADTHFNLVESGPNQTRITARDTGLLLDKASFFVATSHLASCAIHAPPGLRMER